MVRYRRHLLAGGAYFFTLALADRRSSTLVDHIDQLRNAFQTTRKERPFEIDAIVVLPDHLHVVMTLPAGDADFSGRWRRIKGHFSSALLNSGVLIPRRRNGELALWQRRFWEHAIRDDDDFERHVDYVHFNPVKHGLTRRALEWPHSSFHRYVRDGVLPGDWAGEASANGVDYGEPIQ